MGLRTVQLHTQPRLAPLSFTRIIAIGYRRPIPPNPDLFFFNFISPSFAYIHVRLHVGSPSLVIHRSLPNRQYQTGRTWPAITHSISRICMGRNINLHSTSNPT